MRPLRCAVSRCVCVCVCAATLPPPVFVLPSDRHLCVCAATLPPPVCVRVCCPPTATCVCVRASLPPPVCVCVPPYRHLCVCVPPYHHLRVCVCVCVLPPFCRPHPWSWTAHGVAPPLMSWTSSWPHPTHTSPHRPCHLAQIRRMCRCAAGGGEGGRSVCMRVCEGGGGACMCMCVCVCVHVSVCVCVCMRVCASHTHVMRTLPSHPLPLLPLLPLLPIPSHPPLSPSPTPLLPPLPSIPPPPPPPQGDVYVPQFGPHPEPSG